MSLNSSGAVALHKRIASGKGDQSGIAAKTSNPGSPVQAVGKDGHAASRQGMPVPSEATINSPFSTHPGHGSAKRTIKEVSPTSNY